MAAKPPSTQPPVPPFRASSRPLQYTARTPTDFTTPEGVHSFNQDISQIVTTLNSLFGTAGPTVLPSGIDVAGSRVTGLPATPTHPSDAISAGHAATSYSPATQQNQLDIGKPYALKGLSYLYGQVANLNSSSYAVATAQGTNLISSTGLTGSRSFYQTADPDTTPPASPSIFQNTGPGSRIVTVSADGGGGGFHGAVYCDKSATPTTLIARFSRVNAGSSTPNFYPGSVTFVVPSGYYYGISVTSGGAPPVGSSALDSWTEWDLSSTGGSGSGGGGGGLSTGITELTGDVLAGPGIGPQAATVKGVNNLAVPASVNYLGTNSLAQLVAAPVATFPYRALTAAFTLTAIDYQADCTSGTFTVTLPSAVDIPGRVYSIKNSGTGTITVATTAAQTIDGAATQTLTQYDNLVVMSNGSNWIIQ